MIVKDLLKCLAGETNVSYRMIRYSQIYELLKRTKGIKFNTIMISEIHHKIDEYFQENPDCEYKYLGSYCGIPEYDVSRASYDIIRNLEIVSIRVENDTEVVTVRFTSVNDY